MKRATTVGEDKAFRDELFPSDLLEEAIEWISVNLSPEDVFEARSLNVWARDNGFVKEE